MNTSFFIEFIQRLFSAKPEFFKKIQILFIVIIGLAGACIFVDNYFELNTSLIAMCWDTIKILSGALIMSQTPKKDSVDVKKDSVQ